MSFAAHQLRVGAAAHRVRIGPVPRARPPVLIESDYAGRLVAIIGRWRAATHQLVAELPTMLGAGAIAHRDVKPGNIRHDDDPGRRARTAMDQVRAQVEATSHGPALEAMVGSFGRRVADHSKGELSRQALAALGTVPVLTDPDLARQISGFVHENVTLIRKLEHGTLDHIETMLTRAVTTGLGADHVAAEIAARFGIAERHARLIAMDQIGRLDAQLTRSRHLELGLTGYIWRHTPQPHPRHHHVRRDGTRFLYAAPPSDGHPGSLIGCKCGQEPDFAEILGGAEYAGELEVALGAIALPRGVDRPGSDLDDADPDPDLIEAPRPVFAPPGYYVITDQDGTTSYVSHRTGNRYTEADVSAGRLDPPVPPGQIRTAPARRKSVLGRIGAAVKRALRIDGELVAPRGFDPGARGLLEGIPPRDLASPDVACVVPVRAMEWRCVAVPEGGDQSGPVTETRLERIRQAWAINAALPPLRVGLLPDGQLLVRDGRHRLLAALEDGRDVLVLFDAADEAEGDGAVQIEAPAEPVQREDGIGYNPYRDKGGKFAPGAHAKPPNVGGEGRHSAVGATKSKSELVAARATARAARTHAATERSWARLARATDRVAAVRSRLDAAHVAHADALGKRGLATSTARSALGKARDAAELARATPSPRNIRSAQAATKAADRAAKTIDRHTAAVTRHEEAIARHTGVHERAQLALDKAAAAHAKATEAHTKASEALGKATHGAQDAHVAVEHAPVTPAGAAPKPAPTDTARDERGRAKPAGSGAAEPPPVIWERTKNPKRVEAARKAAAASVERRREIHSAVASNLPHELQSTWDKEGHKFMQQEAIRIRGEKDRINAASKISQAFIEQYGSGNETTHGNEGDRYYRRAEIEAKHAESWADAQESKYYAAAARAEQHHQPEHDDDVPF